MCCLIRISNKYYVISCVEFECPIHNIFNKKKYNDDEEEEEKKYRLHIFVVFARRALHLNDKGKEDERQNNNQSFVTFSLTHFYVFYILTYISCLIN